MWHFFRRLTFVLATFAALLVPAVSVSRAQRPMRLGPPFRPSLTLGGQGTVTIFQPHMHFVGPYGRTTHPSRSPSGNTFVGVYMVPQGVGPLPRMPIGPIRTWGGAYLPVLGGPPPYGPVVSGGTPVAPPTPIEGSRIIVDQVSPGGWPGLDRGSAANALDVLGLPNQDGRLAWPLGLRLLPPSPDYDTATAQLEALLQLAGRQLANGEPVDARFVRQASLDVKRLRRLLSESEHRMADTTYVESRRFLKGLDEMLALLQAPAPSRGEEPGPGTSR